MGKRKKNNTDTPRFIYFFKAIFYAFFEINLHYPIFLSYVLNNERYSRSFKNLKRHYNILTHNSSA